MEPARYPTHSGEYFYVYYTKEKGRWVIVAVHPEEEQRVGPFTLRTLTKAVDELGAFQRVNIWLQKSNALAEQGVSLSTTGDSTGATLTGQ